MSNLYDVCNAAGGMTAYEWERDPKRLAFILARYHFVARMMEGKGTVVEVGCSDGFGSRLVAQKVGRLIAFDIDPDAIEIAKSKSYAGWNVEFRHGGAMHIRDIRADGVYALDVLEHIPAHVERDFLGHLHDCAPICIIGSPSIESQDFASALSREGHVNCKTENDLRLTLGHHWSEVFLFGMNDTTLHVGFGPMCHYRFALCTR